jgi:hypothetical protein
VQIKLRPDFIPLPEEDEEITDDFDKIKVGFYEFVEIHIIKSSFKGDKQKLK